MELFLILDDYENKKFGKLFLGKHLLILLKHNITQYLVLCKNFRPSSDCSEFCHP